MQYYAVAQAGWKVIGNKRCYFRSKLEARQAQYLQWRKDAKEILDWEHEPHTFYFEGIRRGTTNYKPDFKVTELDGSHYWIETKGFMDAKSKTKIKRFQKYFPNEKLIIITK